MPRRVHRVLTRGLRRRHEDKTGVDRLVPEPPAPPRRRRGGGEPRGFRIRVFGPYFLAIAAIVGIERVSMLVAVSEGFSTTVRTFALGVFFAVVFSLIAFGGRWFGRQFAAARNPEL